MNKKIEALNEGKVSEWVAKSLAAKNKDFSPPFDFELITTGQSNLSFTVSDSAKNRWVLRRPPLQQVLATAHDMVREYTIISALHPAGFLVPEPIALYENGELAERPFYLMEFVDGLIISDVESTENVSEDLRRESGFALAETLVHLHSLNPDEIGLSGLAKKEDYIARQLYRWLKQFKQSKADQSEDVEKIHNILAENIPPQKYTGIVHADYRLDNCVLDGDTGKVKAVLDWEICTLGDTLADLGTLLAYWADSVLADSATAQPGFATRQELLEKYGEVSGKDLGQIDYYLAFAYWRIACILQGVYSRYLDDAMPGKTPPGGIEVLKSRIDVMIEKTWTYTEKI